MAAPSISAHLLPISIGTPSRDSMTFTSTKGLLNGPGQNNCFLNSAVQVLWHLDIFRRSFRDLSGHACMADSCIFCALKELFSQLQFSNETALPPDALRRALAESFFDQQRFQLGFMDDAAECFENMLLRIHMHIAHGEAEDMCNARHCIPHQKFAMTLVEQSVCGTCGATSEPLSYTQMVHYVSTSTLVYQIRNNSNRPQNMPDSFGQLLRKAGNMGDVRVCPSACGAVIQIGRTLMNRPEIVSVGLVWNSERPTLEHIMEVFSTIGTTLRLSDVFNTVVDTRWVETSMHNLVGVVTYYGKHYSTFFFHTKLRVWIYFDDATVREVGPRWDQVVEKCRKGRYQPLLLLYALPDGTPVNTDNAPKQVTPFYSDNKNASTNKKQTTVLRRSVTPSPEKPIIGNTRRAITPNPDGTLNQKPPLPRPLYNEYQNLSVIQNNLYGTKMDSARGIDVVDGDIARTRSHINVHRTLSNSSSSGVEGMSIPDHMNIPRRRDSGNWSGDRNSASSSSSTTMENNYLCLPGSPTRTKSDSASSGSSSGGVYDAGYDSYSLSSNDSSTMTTIQHLMKMGHLAKIPEDYNNTPAAQPSQSCDVLCDEADELLVKSRQLEDEHDLVLALALCNAAATKARAAMNAPYNNPQTLTLARMKHNTCIMRARSLHRRMTQPPSQGKDAPPEIRHTREGSSGSGGRHSRQSSRDKGQHSRQNSRELLVVQQQPTQPAPAPSQEKQQHQQQSKNIEIYATLPKKKDAFKNKMTIDIGEDVEYVAFDKPPGRESRSIFSRSNKNSSKESHKVREKRSRSEDRNKMTRDFSIAPEIISGKDTLKREKLKEEKEDKKEKDGGKPKKQHKIRRKLLMGGLIKRKNRSMPDLTDAANVENERPVVEIPVSTVDDSNVGLKGNNAAGEKSMCGYLSEGHLEFTGNNSTNPNLERSKLMRKSYHGSAGKILTAAKVPPPPPLRTTSQLSASKLVGGEVCDDKSERPMYPLPNELSSSPYYNHHTNIEQNIYNQPPMSSLPYIMHDYYDYNNHPLSQSPQNMVVTRADVHQEQNNSYNNINQTNNQDCGVDEVDCLPSCHNNNNSIINQNSDLPSQYPMHNINSRQGMMLLSATQNLDLPPYPSPLNSAVHSRQPSEEFPPPPPPLDLSALDEHLKDYSPPALAPSPGTLLAQLQNKRHQILSHEPELKRTIQEPVVSKASGDTWLRELQAKQAALRMKKNQPNDNTGAGYDDTGIDVVNTQRYLPGEMPSAGSNSNVTSVRDLATKFESIKVQPLEIASNSANIARSIHLQINQNDQFEMSNRCNNNNINNGVACVKKDELSIAPEQIAEEIREVEMLNAAVQKTINAAKENNNEDYLRKNRLGKNKKSVSFCDQVILVATADEQEDDSYIPNPILERVLRSAMNKPEAATIRQEIMALREAEDAKFCEMLDLAPPPLLKEEQYVHQPLYVRRNSVDNLLSKQQIPNVVDANYSLNNGGNSYAYCNNGHTPPYRNNYPCQQTLSQNSQIYVSNPKVNHPLPNHQYIKQNQNNINYSPTPLQDCNNMQYSSSPTMMYHHQQQMRQSPNPMHNYYQNPSGVYQHPQSPSPSDNSYGYHQYSRQSPITNNNNNSYQYPPYQRVPPSQQYPPASAMPDPMYQKTEIDHHHQQQQQHQANINYQNQQRFASLNDPTYQKLPPQMDHPDQINNYVSKVPSNNNNNNINNNCYYQRVPQPHQPYTDMPKYPVYQHALPPKQPLKKSVSFEPGTKDGAESPAASCKAVVTPIIVNNANNSVPTGKTKCNLCRKKIVVSSNLYCTDCEFYMSRFAPKS